MFRPGIACATVGDTTLPKTNAVERCDTIHYGACIDALPLDMEENVIFET